MIELLYRENQSEFESEAEDSEYNSEEDEDLGEKIKKTSSETKSINNKPPIKSISNIIPPTKWILLTIHRALVYKYSCEHTRRIRYPLEKLCTTTKMIRIDTISNIKEYKETKFQRVMVKKNHDQKATSNPKKNQLRRHSNMQSQKQKIIKTTDIFIQGENTNNKTMHNY